VIPTPAFNTRLLNKAGESTQQSAVSSKQKCLTRKELAKKKKRIIKEKQERKNIFFNKSDL
jgi:hypothetical protein